MKDIILPTLRPVSAKVRKFQTRSRFRFLFSLNLLTSYPEFLPHPDSVLFAVGKVPQVDTHLCGYSLLSSDSLLSLKAIMDCLIISYLTVTQLTEINLNM